MLQFVRVPNSEVHQWGTLLYQVQNLKPQAVGYWSLSEIESEIKNSTSNLCLEMLDQKIEGFIFYTQSSLGNENVVLIEIRHWAVKSKGRGRGTQFFKEFLKHFESFSHKSIEFNLEVSSKNPAAIRLYQKLGFVQVGQRKAYYKDGSDAYLFRKN